VGAIRVEVIGFFNRPNPSKQHYGLRIDTASDRIEYQESSGVKCGRPARKDDNFTDTCEPISSEM
jgi:hypothetical protein